MKLEKHRQLAEIGEKGLSNLEKKSVSIVGVGSVGSVVAEILARTQLSLRIIDKGRVEEEDLLSSSLYTPEEITRFKAKEAKKLLERIHPQAKIKTFHEELNDKNIFLIDADIVIDCTNKIEAHELVNKRCKQAKLACLTVNYAGTAFLVLPSKGSYNVEKWEKHVEKLGKVEEKGLLAGLGHIAGGMVASETLLVLLGKALPKKPYRYDVLHGTKKEFSL